MIDEEEEEKKLNYDKAKKYLAKYKDNIKEIKRSLDEVGENPTSKQIKEKYGDNKQFEKLKKVRNNYDVGKEIVDTYDKETSRTKEKRSHPLTK